MALKLAEEQAEREEEERKEEEASNPMKVSYLLYLFGIHKLQNDSKDFLKTFHDLSASYI